VLKKDKFGRAVGKTAAGAVHPAQLAQRSRQASASDESHKLGGAVVTSLPGAAVVTAEVIGISGEIVEVSNSGVAVVACVAGLGVVAIAISAGTVVKPKIGDVVAAEGAEVVAVTSGGAEVANASGSEVGTEKIDGRSVVAVSGTAVVTGFAVENGESVVTPSCAEHPSNVRSSTHARCSASDHAPSGPSAFATKAAHSSGCLEMQHSTLLTGFRQSLLKSQGATVKHCCPYSASPGQTSLQAANGSSGADVGLTVTPGVECAGGAVV
jgi:hypothetical protein